MHLRNIDGTEFVEFLLNQDDPAVGKTVAQIAKILPDKCVLVSVRREGMILIPHGNTKFQAGDSVTAFVHQSAVGDVRACLTA